MGSNSRLDRWSRAAWYPWFVVAVLMLIYTSSFVDRQILGLLVKPVRAFLQITDTQFSYLIGLSFALLYSIAGIPIGAIVDRWNRTRVVVIGVVVWSVMTGACGMVGSYATFFLARVGVGLGEATLSPATYSMVSDLFPAKRLARALSIFGLGVPIGSGLAMVIGGPLVEKLNRIGPVDIPFVGQTLPWQMVFFIVGAPGLLLALLALLVIREPQRKVTALEDAQKKPAIGAIFAFLWANRGAYTPIFFGFSMVAMYWYGAAAWLPTYLQRVHGFSIGQAGLFLGLSTLTLGISGTLLAGWLADRLITRGHDDAHFRVGILFAVGSLVCGGAGAIVTLPWLSLTLIFLNGLFSFTLVGVNAAALQLVTPNRMRGQVSAIYLCVLNLISLGLGPTAVALCTDYVFHSEGAIGSSIATVALVCVATGCTVMQLGRKKVAAMIGEYRRLSAEVNPAAASGARRIRRA